MCNRVEYLVGFRKGNSICVIDFMQVVDDELDAVLTEIVTYLSRFQLASECLKISKGVVRCFVM